ncbi:hypothetical protein MTP04_35830 [Lysinibacillus sp. PLM2]|nr:hypothetical protein MTP04_35830 [Lysinibacillus sp. PLM2]
MKKWSTLLLACLFALLLTACNSTATPVENTPEENESENTNEGTPESTEEESSVSDLTLEEVFEKAIERQNEISSLTAEVKMDQTITSGGVETAVNSDMVMDMTIDPMTMYAKGASTTVDPTTGEDVKLGYEMYMVEDGFYMYDEMSKAWMLMPIDNYEDMLGQAANQADASQQLEMLQSFVEDFTFEQNDNQFILTLDASGEKFTDFIYEQIASTGVVGSEEEIAAIQINDLSYVLVINKDTFDTEEITMVMDLADPTAEESVIMDTSMVFSNINGIGSIEVPQEVIDTATELTF